MIAAVGFRRTPKWGKHPRYSRVGFGTTDRSHEKASEGEFRKARGASRVTHIEN